MTLTGTTTIYHNPNCSSSRKTLALLEAHGVTPQVVEYLKTPPSCERIQELLTAMGLTARDVLRVNEPQYLTLGLENPALSDAQLVQAMAAHPILINRPIVASALGTRLCRPAERVLEILPVV